MPDLKKPHVAITLVDISAKDRIPERTLILKEPSWSMKIGRASSSTDTDFRPTRSNAYFDSRVVSRSHAVLSADPKSRAVWLRDVNSMHGTHLGGDKLDVEEDVELEQDDVVTLGANIDRGDVRFPALELRISYLWTDEASTTTSISSVTQPTLQVHKPGNTFSVDYSDLESHSDSDIEYVGVSHRCEDDYPILDKKLDMQKSSETSDVDSDEFDGTDISTNTPSLDPTNTEDKNVPKKFIAESLMMAEQDLFGDDCEISDSDLCYDSGPFAQMHIPSDLPQPLGAFPDTVLPLESLDNIESAFGSGREQSDLWLTETSDQARNQQERQNPGVSSSGIIAVKDLLNADDAKVGAEQLQTPPQHFPRASAGVHAGTDSSHHLAHQTECNSSRHQQGPVHPLGSYDPIDSSELYIMDGPAFEWTPGTILARMTSETASLADPNMSPAAPKPPQANLNESNGGYIASELSNPILDFPNVLKRKADEISQHETVPEKAIRSNLHVEGVTVKRSLQSDIRLKDSIKRARQAYPSTEANQHRAKRQKTTNDGSSSVASHTAAALVGIVLGVVGTIFGLAALPADFFV